MEVISPARKGMKTKPMIQNLIPFPVDTWRRFNVCLTTHSRRKRLKQHRMSIVKQTIKDYKDFEIYKQSIN